MAVTTSPGFVAPPPGMFSHRGIKTFKLSGRLRAAAVYNDPVTHAAPPISALILSMSFEGLMEIPPVSNVTPFPMKTKNGNICVTLPVIHV